MRLFVDDDDDDERYSCPIFKGVSLTVKVNIQKKIKGVLFFFQIICGIVFLFSVLQQTLDKVTFGKRWTQEEEMVQQVVTKDEKEAGIVGKRL